MQTTQLASWCRDCTVHIDRLKRPLHLTQNKRRANKVYGTGAVGSATRESLPSITEELQAKAAAAAGGQL